MILYINTTDAESVHIALIKGGKVVKKRKFKAKYRQSEKFLPEIDKLLKSLKKSIKDIKGVAVVKGPGPFTALRIGVATANALGYSLRVPVAGMQNVEFRIQNSEFKMQNELLRKYFKHRNRCRKFNIIEPVYGKEPNLTIKK